MRKEAPVVRFTPRGRVRLDVLALQRELAAGTLSDRDRELLMGKVKGIRI